MTKIMTEHPIIFSTPMVKAILDGRKTQTRRVVKPQAHHYNPDLLQPQILYPCKEGEPWGDIDKPVRNSYGLKGSRLWVKETFCHHKKGKVDFIYKSNNNGDKAKKIKWKPSIHMPRTAARIFLEITDIKIERLQDISEEDAKAEGVILFHQHTSTLCEQLFSNHIKAYAHLWCSIQKSEDAWIDNPWVWVINFKKLINH